MPPPLRVLRQRPEAVSWHKIAGMRRTSRPQPLSARVAPGAGESPPLAGALEVVEQNRLERAALADRLLVDLDGPIVVLQDEVCGGDPAKLLRRVKATLLRVGDLAPRDLTEESLEVRALEKPRESRLGIERTHEMVAAIGRGAQRLDGVVGTALVRGDDGPDEIGGASVRIVARRVGEQKLLAAPQGSALMGEDREGGEERQRQQESQSPLTRRGGGEALLHQEHRAAQSPGEHEVEVAVRQREVERDDLRYGCEAREGSDPEACFGRAAAQRQRGPSDQREPGEQAEEPARGS